MSRLHSKYGLVTTPIQEEFNSITYPQAWLRIVVRSLEPLFVGIQPSDRKSDLNPLLEAEPGLWLEEQGKISAPNHYKNTTHP